MVGFMIGIFDLWNGLGIEWFYGMNFDKVV